MDNNLKEFLKVVGWGALVFIWVLALVNNTVFPIIKGETAYALFNLFVCALAFFTLRRLYFKYIHKEGK